ncbi:MAG: redoxin domain-containing protein [Hymenobacter sp.]
MTKTFTPATYVHVATRFLPTLVSAHTPFSRPLTATAQHLATVLPAAAARSIDGGHCPHRSRRYCPPRPGRRPATNFTLPDADGQPQILAELLTQGPVVLTFYRGNWCPYCSVQLRHRWEA